MTAAQSAAGAHPHRPHLSCFLRQNSRPAAAVGCLPHQGPAAAQGRAGQQAPVAAVGPRWTVQPHPLQTPPDGATAYPPLSPPARLQGSVPWTLLLACPCTCTAHCVRQTCSATDLDMEPAAAMPSAHTDFVRRFSRYCLQPRPGASCWLFPCTGRLSRVKGLQHPCSTSFSAHCLPALAQTQHRL